MMLWSLYFLLLCALIAILLVIKQIKCGLDDADRIVALDVLFATALILCIAGALMIERTVLIDAAIGLALVGFIGTVGWATVIKRKNEKKLMQQKKDNQ